MLSERLKTFSMPGHTPFQALQRFAVLSESFYAQRITWDKKTWLPNVTPLRKLKVFITLSALLVVADLILLYILAKEVLSYRKDAEFTLTAAVLLVMVFCVLSTAIFVSQMYLFHGKELCFIYRNMNTLKEMCRTEGGTEAGLGSASSKKSCFEGF
ncbi:hypothetical protein Fcan01_17575 [Folsomia candida]|uniref:Uncharacterized protein n=1 Tax=Folsomia candida TaxID=158441 RepID=A0A226DRI2_FOLCA|nr:hypothetical protein Fcan01_17575 [Folsomia candida]